MFALHKIKEQTPLKIGPASKGISFSKHHFLGGELFEGYLCVATGRESDAFSTAKFVKFGKFPKFRLSLESIRWT